MSKTLDLFDFEESTVNSTAQTLYQGLYPMQPHPSGVGHIIHVPDGELYYAPNFLTAKIADRAMDVLLGNDQFSWRETDWHQVTDVADIKWNCIHWQHDIIQMYGKQHYLPRFSAWHGDHDRAYTYSGIKLHPAPWNPLLIWLQAQLKSACGQRFNSVLLNWYRSGEDHISWHTDDELELGTNPTIASINFGATRRFLLRRNSDHSEKIELPLGHGSLLIMSGALQHHWQHSVPKEKKVKQSRVNLTFRIIK